MARANPARQRPRSSARCARGGTRFVERDCAGHRSPVTTAAVARRGAHGIWPCGGGQPALLPAVRGVLRHQVSEPLAVRASVSTRFAGGGTRRDRAPGKRAEAWQWRPPLLPLWCPAARGHRTASSELPTRARYQILLSGVIYQIVYGRRRGAGVHCRRIRFSTGRCTAKAHRRLADMQAIYSPLSRTVLLKSTASSQAGSRAKSAGKKPGCRHSSKSPLSECRW